MEKLILIATFGIIALIAFAYLFIKIIKWLIPLLLLTILGTTLVKILINKYKNN